MAYLDASFNESPQRSPMAFSSPFRPLFGITLLLGLVAGGCSPIIETRGYLPDPAVIEQIQPGAQTRSDVVELLGTPSTVAAFDDNTWIYVQSKTERLAFFQPTVLEQNVVVVEFDEAGVVRDVRRYTLEDGIPIDPVTRQTPAPGKELTILQQLIGNVGRFTPNASSR